MYINFDEVACNGTGWVQEIEEYSVVFPSKPNVKLLDAVTKMLENYTEEEIERIMDERRSQQKARLC